MSDWDDLFAKAAGHETNNVEQLPSARSPLERKRKKRNRAPKENDASFRDMLEGRRKVPGLDTKWPPWTRLGESMNRSKPCTCWEESSESSGEKRFINCASCGANPMLHKLKVSDRFAWPLRMFCLVRNLRCIGGLVANGDITICQLKNSAQSEARMFGQIMSETGSSLPPGEAELLNQKCQTVLNAIDLLLRQAKRKGTKKLHDLGSEPRFFEEAVRLMIGCDDVYYRLYYLQISQILPARQKDYLLHPADYFHIPFLAWEGMDCKIMHSCEDLLQSISIEHEAPHELNDGEEDLTKRELMDEVVARYGIARNSTEGLPKYSDVLSYLHRNRAVETTRLFRESKWIQSRPASKEMMEELNKPISENDLSRHETPAPSILSEWRDSCRDKLCNLYAYATLPPQAAERINSSLRNAGISGGIIEIGAGTGYVASLLKDAGIKVFAWDVRPPGSSKSNEYHGSTPEFYKISEGEPSDLRLRFPPLNTEADEALLLCYPPPDSQMAKEALEAYLACGGKCFVHVGEFSGLTGSPAFENLLVRHFHCVDRFPCLAWGTDASEITIWLRDGKVQDRLERHFLFPCSSCKKSESLKRCRIVRHLAYCSQVCFQDRCTQASIAVHLAMNLIPLRVESLNFRDDRHFMLIRKSTWR